MQVSVDLGCARLNLDNDICKAALWHPAPIPSGNCNTKSRVPVGCLFPKQLPSLGFQQLDPFASPRPLWTRGHRLTPSCGDGARLVLSDRTPPRAEAGLQRAVRGPGARPKHPPLSKPRPVYGRPARAYLSVGCPRLAEARGRPALALALAGRAGWRRQAMSKASWRRLLGQLALWRHLSAPEHASGYRQALASLEALG